MKAGNEHLIAAQLKKVTDIAKGKSESDDAKITLLGKFAEVEADDTVKPGEIASLGPSDAERSKEQQERLDLEELLNEAEKGKLKLAATLKKKVSHNPPDDDDDDYGDSDSSAGEDPNNPQFKVFQNILKVVTKLGKKDHGGRSLNKSH
jgi:hypothetical protein